MNETADGSYAQRLITLESRWWKRVLDVQAPYRLHLRSLGLGRVLEVGCGIGRNLSHLHGNGVGIDRDPEVVAVAQSRGLRAFTVEEFRSGKLPEFALGSYDSLLIAHVLEHMSLKEAAELVQDHLKYVRTGGKVILIVPQQAGYRSDATHRNYLDHAGLKHIAVLAGLRLSRTYSFPFPAVAGHVFRHNESVLIAHKR